ncbi:MAG: carbamoyltransferase [Nitrospirae bacterium]|nr:carbamoyltransferase [Nitrospirota bacterium]
MIIVGINNMHDASAALVIDGEVVAAAEEERFTRIKHTRGFPVNAVRFCLDYAGIKIGDVDIVCASWKPWALRVRTTLALKSILKSPRLFKAKTSRGMRQMQNEWSELFRLRGLVQRCFGKGKYKIEYVDHHLAHAASAFLCSPFERAAILTVDGAGEADTTVLWIGEGTGIKKINSVKLPHSLGQFYSAVTAFLGFNSQSDEYKVMGLASYGEPVYADYLSKNVVKCLPDGSFRMDPYFIDYHIARNGGFRTSTTDVFGEPRKKEEAIVNRHADVAASAQKVMEEAIFHLANSLHEMTGLDELCMAGGVAFNCVANGKLFQKTPFKNIFIQPAAGDAGSAIGAALITEHKYTGSPRHYVMNHAYLGPSFSSTECQRVLKDKIIRYERLGEDVLLQRTAHALAEGKLVCWFQGRMEWGPRALGNRSFLADPRREEMKDIINLKIKQREQFRPFAPSVLEEKSPGYFDYTGNSPFMLYAFPVKPEKRSLIPAVTHVDGTARPQTVNKETNPLYWKLINEFEKLTGVPILLNTSFNVQEPIVCTPGEALESFIRTKVDYLVLNDLFIEHPST